MNLNIASVAVGLLARPATLVRPTGSYVGGRWIEGTPAETPITACIQSSTQDDMRVLPEGERTDGYVTIWTTTELRTVDEDDAANADIIRSPEGPEYRVIKSGARKEGGFWRVIGRLVVDRGRSR